MLPLLPAADPIFVGICIFIGCLVLVYLGAMVASAIRNRDES